MARPRFTGAEEFVPARVPHNRAGLERLADAARGCTGCDLYAAATQMVFDDGDASARLVLVGEQPGDQEDRQGHPFVGPAGRVLHECLGHAGIDVGDVYFTNAVKHFRHTDRGKRRIHQRPTTEHIDACHAWLDSEMTVVDPPVVVALGAVAVRGLTGRTQAIAPLRGAPLDLDGRALFVTYHPSAALRADSRRAEIRDAIVTDLRAAAAWTGVTPQRR